VQRGLLDISRRFLILRGSFVSSLSVMRPAEESVLYVIWQEQGIYGAGPNGRAV
jgi:hypothetical protein